MIRLGTTVLSLLSLATANERNYPPTWEGLDARPIPPWYDRAKFGIIIHWGVYSVPSFGSESFWLYWKSDEQKQAKYEEFMNKYPDGFTYQEFAKDFTAKLFEPKHWAELFAKAGAKYVVLTSKHHDGYALWPSSYSWNSMDIGPHRDLVGELAEEVRARNLTFGLFYTLSEWFHPLYQADKTANFTTQAFIEAKIAPERKELVLRYEPEVFFSDGSGDADYTYWKSTEFLAWLYNDSPVKDTVVVNDRWGTDMACNHGGYFMCIDRYNPAVLLEHKWENVMTIEKQSWGYRREATLSDYLTIQELITQLVTTVSCGGNVLLNVGPTKDGTIDPIFEERLMQLGQWLEVNGEAIYATIPWIHQNDSGISGVWYTEKDDAVYAIALHWTEVLALASPRKLFRASTNVTLLGNEDAGNLPWTVTDSSVKITLPAKATVKSEWAWVLKIVSTPTSSCTHPETHLRMLVTAALLWTVLSYY
ncbi:hypothetical protein NQ315_001256 [Exocentrus adspersus]|uniref:Putative alpha-L-fucosidase n=1 Tax=Exocentrus adspersus TaxID=1586481 RepID=A0AAV8WEX5_9CUCU|nr:hypothetical protein NQ315_001256 [Exocentrus adspersus]